MIQMVIGVGLHDGYRIQIYGVKGVRDGIKRGLR